MDTINTATMIESYPVKKLEEFKGVSLEAGQFLARKIEKGTGKDSTGVIIPAVTQSQFVMALEDDSILGAAVEWYQSQVENAVKARIAVGATTIILEDMSISAVSAYLDQVAVSEGRVSKEKIAAWFDSTVAANLSAALVAKFGEAMTPEKLQQNLKSYRDVFSLLAKKEYSFNEKQVINLNKCLDLLPDSNMKNYCSKKIAEFAPKESDMSAL